MYFDDKNHYICIQCPQILDFDVLKNECNRTYSVKDRAGFI